MKKRWLSIMLAVTCAGSALMGCASGGTASSANTTAAARTSQEAESAKEESAEADAGEPITLRFCWWGSDPRHEATLKAIERYQELHPNITIEGEYQGYDGYQQKLMTQLAGKTEPDLMQLDYVWYPDLSGDAFIDMEQDPNIDLSVYSESILKEYCSIDGKVIALPMGINGFGAMINTSFFEKYQIPVDTVWTWEKMIEEGKRIHAENPDDYLFAIESGTSTGGIGPFVMGAYIYSKTGQYWVSDEDYQIHASKEDLITAFTVLRDLFESGAAQPLGEASLFTGQMEQNPKWLNGEMGFTIDWSSTVEKYKDAAGEDNFAVAMPPFAENGENQEISTKPSMVLAVSSRSPYAEEAAQFANWLMSDPEAAVILGTQRSVPSASTSFEVLQEENAIDPDVARMCEFTNANPAPPVPFIQSNTELSDVVKDICEQVVYGQLTPEDAADKFLTDVQAKLDTLKAAE